MKRLILKNPTSFRPNLFMWENRTLIFGSVAYLGLHSMGTFAINVGMYQPFYLKTVDGSYQPYRCAIIPAGCDHELFCNGNVIASLMIEKNSADFMRLKKRFSFSSTTITPVDDVEWIDVFQTIYQENLTKTQIQQLIDKLLNVEMEMTHQLDPRIDSIMQTIRLDSGTEFSQEYLANTVGLSPSRFRHLFREQSDIPYSRYKIWRRVITAMETLHKVDNLTHAAMEAGFTDSAHFNRCFRATFGVNPSLMFKNMDRFDV